MELKVLANGASKLKNLLGVKGLKIKAASPNILMVVGVAGVVGGTIYACAQTTKLKDILEEGKEKRDEIKASYDEIKSEDVDASDAEKAYRKDITVTYAATAGEVIKLYAGPVIVETLSISCMLYSNKILRNRLVGLAAAYTTVNESFKKYRQRVIDKYGEDAEREIRLGTVKKKLKDVNPEAVTEENKKDKVDVLNDESIDINNDPYTFIFGSQYSKRAEKDPYFNKKYLESVKRKFNDILKARGYVFLNEVLEYLDLGMTEAGQVTGWIYNSEDGDGYIDFGIDTVYLESNNRFIEGAEECALLSFNVDGYILDEVWKVDRSYPRHWENKRPV